MPERDRMTTFSIRIPNEALTAIDQARAQGCFRARAAHGFAMRSSTIS